MRILIAPDKFKGSVGAQAVGEEIAAGLRTVCPDAEISIQPIADGGEGTTEVLRRALGAEVAQCRVHDALGREISASFAWAPSTLTACLDISAAAGIAQLQPDERDPLRASTYGVGEMLHAAMGRGARTVFVGLGGSATNDGGTGLARALGFRFLDAGGCELSDIGRMEALARIVPPNEFALPKVIALSDVRNPLLGPGGATRTFAPQKGATADEIEVLERALTRLAEVVAQTQPDLRHVAGAGAAGGLGFGLLAFCGAKLRPGFDVIAEMIGLREMIGAADYVITGEGNLDRQTREGKAPAGVAKIARGLGKPVFAFAGRCSGEEELSGLFDRIFSLNNDPPFTTTPELLRSRAAELARHLSGMQ